MSDIKRKGCLSIFGNSGNQEPWAYATGYEDRRYASVSQRA